MKKIAIKVHTVDQCKALQALLPSKWERGKKYLPLAGVLLFPAEKFHNSVGWCHPGDPIPEDYAVLDFRYDMDRILNFFEQEKPPFEKIFGEQVWWDEDGIVAANTPSGNSMTLTNDEIAEAHYYQNCRNMIESKTSNRGYGFDFHTEHLYVSVSRNRIPRTSYGDLAKLFHKLDMEQK